MPSMIFNIILMPHQVHQKSYFGFAGLPIAFLNYSQIFPGCADTIPAQFFWPEHQI